MGTNFDLYDKWLWVKAYLELANKGDRKIKYMNYLSASGGSFPYFVVSGHSSPATRDPRLSTGIPAYTVGSSYWENFPRLPGFCPIHVPNQCIFFEGTNTLTYGGMRPGGEYQNRVGTIMTDFPGWGLINRIIDLNKPFWKVPNRRPNECNENVPRNCGRVRGRSK